MNPTVSAVIAFAVGTGILYLLLHLDAKSWKRRYEPEDRRRDRIDTELDDLRRLEEWRAALERQQKNIRIGHKDRRNNGKESK
jgi:hypothetical protein